MSQYIYQKTKKRSFKKYVRLIGALCIFVGATFLAYFFFPLISYQIFLSPVFAQANIETPVPKYLVVKNNELKSLFSQGISSLLMDYTDARNWYPNLPNDAKKTKVDSYALSIPKLKIENAVVSTNDYDLSKHLVQYFGTTIPPEKGTAVIFGHSTLPQWFDSKNYKTIFATLHTIGIGDEMLININGLIYKYKIFSINITSAEDTNMFTQSFDNSYLTLVTCTPPGTTWKRLVVRASLEM